MGRNFIDTLPFDSPRLRLKSFKRRKIFFEQRQSSAYLLASLSSFDGKFQVTCNSEGARFLEFHKESVTDIHHSFAPVRFYPILLTFRSHSTLLHLLALRGLTIQTYILP